MQQVYTVAVHPPTLCVANMSSMSDIQESLSVSVCACKKMIGPDFSGLIEVATLFLD